MQNRMNIVKITETNSEAEYKASEETIREFLYMFFEISGDCRPVGDWDRAEIGTVNPFRFLDIDYEYEYQLRSSSEIKFMHEGAAVNLLCRLASFYDLDECSGSTLMADFNNEASRKEKSDAINANAPDLFKIHEAFASGRIVKTPCIQDAFKAAFSGCEEFYSSLKKVLAEVIFKAFENQ